MRTTAWAQWRRRELVMVEGYVFQLYSITNSSTTLFTERERETM